MPTQTRVSNALFWLLHLALVAALAVAYVSADEVWLDVHVIAGYTVAGLVLLHVIVGLLGPREQRFSGMGYRPGTLVAYVKQLFLLRPPRYLDGNPVGGLIYAAMLVVIVLAILSGLLYYPTTALASPLSGWLPANSPRVADLLEESHELFAGAATILIAFHLLGICLERMLRRAQPSQLTFNDNHSEVQ